MMLHDICKSKEKTNEIKNDIVKAYTKVDPDFYNQMYIHSGS